MEDCWCCWEEVVRRWESESGVHETGGGRGRDDVADKRTRQMVIADGRREGIGPCGHVLASLLVYVCVSQSQCTSPSCSRLPTRSHINHLVKQGSLICLLVRSKHYFGTCSSQLLAHRFAHGSKVISSTQCNIHPWCCVIVVCCLSVSE